MTEKQKPEPVRTRRHLTFEDLMDIHRVSSPAVSPDGRYAAYVTTKHDHIKNTQRSTIHLLDLQTKESRILTPGPGSHSCPVWSPCGDYLAFVSDREGEGSQLWLLPFREGGEARKLTRGSGGVSQVVFSPEGKRIAFARQVIVSPYFDEKRFENERAADEDRDKKEPTRADIYGLINPKSTARIEDSLLFRHWDHWRDRKRSHVFILDLETGNMRDLTPEDRDSPPISLGGSQDIAFSPDGAEIAVVWNPDREVARSTNNSIYTIPLNGIEPAGKPGRISINDGCDCEPRYSPDGRHLLYLGMKRPKYEADRKRLMLYHRKTGETTDLTPEFDRSPSEPVFSPDTRYIYFHANDRMRETIYRLNLKNHKIEQLTLDTNNAAFRLIPGSNDLLVQRNSTTEPDDLYRLQIKGIKPYLRSAPTPKNLPADAGAKAERLTFHGKLPEEIKMHPIEEFWYRGAGSAPVHGAVIRPPNYRKGRKYPTIFIVHGGPQGMFADTFHYRWNFQLFASEGYVVVFTNPRGSTGYGQEFTDGVTRDWGGKAFEDLMKGLDYAIKHFDFIDPERIGAAGASFGGFMMNYFEGHTDRFKCLVSHDGIFHGETMAYTTDELWFEEWEHGTLPPERDELIKFSPHTAVKNFRTPMLLIHGEMDFRCPISEGIGMFTALQIMGVPSKILFFPDEGHWVLKPANSQVWYRTILDWFAGWLKKGKKKV